MLLGISDRGLFQHRHSLGTLVGCPQRARIGDRSIRIVRVLAIAGTKRLKRMSGFVRAGRGRVRGAHEPVVSRAPILEQPPADRARMTRQGGRGEQIGGAGSRWHSRAIKR